MRMVFTPIPAGHLVPSARARGLHGILLGRTTTRFGVQGGSGARSGIFLACVGAGWPAAREQRESKLAEFCGSVAVKQPL